MGRKAAENSKLRTIRAYEPRTKTQQRKWWWSVINHHHKTGTSLRDAYGKRFPGWLEEEVRCANPQRWLALYDLKTGKRRERGEAASSAPTIAITYLERLAQKKESSRPRNSASKQRHKDPATVEKRLNRRMEDVEVLVRRVATRHTSTRN
jgi:hypothetical protein